MQASGKDPLFSGAGKADPELAEKAVRERLGPPAAVLTNYAPAFDMLTSILTGGGTARRRVISGAQNEDGDAGGSDVPRPLATASTLSEVFCSNMRRACRSPR